jgi:exodeoxyribonuclease VII small subunit
VSEDRVEHTLESIEALVQDGNFEATLAGLEWVVDRLECGGLSIDEAIAWYEAGLALMRRCSRLLETAELRIRTLEETYLEQDGAGADWSADVSR